MASYISILKRRKQSRRPPNQRTRYEIRGWRSAVEHKHLKSNLTTATRTLISRTKNMSPNVGISMILPSEKALQNALKQSRGKEAASNYTMRLSVRGLCPSSSTAHFMLSLLCASHYDKPSRRGYRLQAVEVLMISAK